MVNAEDFFYSMFKYLILILTLQHAHTLDCWRYPVLALVYCYFANHNCLSSAKNGASLLSPENSNFAIRILLLFLSGVRLGNLYCDPLVTSAGHKITGRQRWTPTPVQLQILERIFEQGNGTPTKQKIKEITSELSQHGQISETNVYNWFQNRRARSKRKQQVSAPNNAESEVETEVESPNDNKTKSEDFQSQHDSVPRAEDLCFQNPEISSGMHSIDPRSHKVEPVFPSDTNSKPAGSMGQMSFYGSMLSNPSMYIYNI